MNMHSTLLKNGTKINSPACLFGLVFWVLRQIGDEFTGQASGMALHWV